MPDKIEVLGWRTIMHDIAIMRVLESTGTADFQTDADLNPKDEHRFYEVRSPNWPASMCLFISVHQDDEMPTPSLFMEVREPNWGDTFEGVSGLSGPLSYHGGIMLAEPIIRLAVERYRATGLL